MDVDYTHTRKIILQWVYSCQVTALVFYREYINHQCEDRQIVLMYPWSLVVFLWFMLVKAMLNNRMTVSS